MIQGLTVQVGGVREDIGDVKKELGERIAEGNKATDDLRKRMDHSDATFADRVAEVVAKLPGSGVNFSVPVSSSVGQSGFAIIQGGLSDGAANDVGASASFQMSYASCAGLPAANIPSIPKPRGPSKEETYWLCRRSLRIWPIPDGDVKKGLGQYLKARLCLGPNFLTDMGEISVKRVAAGPRSKITGEVIAVFATVEVRDAVRGAAKELAGSPDAGMRLEIPRFLQPSLKALEAVSFNLKKKFPNIKRNIKFDDGEMDLVLDFCTNPDAGEQWRKVRPAQAKIKKASMVRSGQTVEVSSDELEKMMEINITPGGSMSSGPS